jgi:undecaprenyl-diphosphatase
VDGRLERWIVAHRVGFLDGAFVALTHAGGAGVVWLVAAAAVALLRGRRRVFVLVAVADLAAALAANGLQRAFAHHRPDVSRLVALPHSHSFPSGHATTSFACATVLAVLEPRLRAPALLLATAIAYSRLYVGVHFPGDVLAGAALGAAIGLLTSGAALRRGLRAPRAG